MGRFPLREKRLGERIAGYLWEKGWPDPYKMEELGDKYFLLDWVALVCHRPVKTRQLLMYGSPSTQKTLFLTRLSRVLQVYRGRSNIPDD